MEVKARAPPSGSFSKCLCGQDRDKSSAPPLLSNPCWLLMGPCRELLPLVAVSILIPLLQSGLRFFFSCGTKVIQSRWGLPCTLPKRGLQDERLFQLSAMPIQPGLAWKWLWTWTEWKATSSFSGMTSLHLTFLISVVKLSQQTCFYNSHWCACCTSSIKGPKVNLKLPDKPDPGGFLFGVCNK